MPLADAKERFVQALREGSLAPTVIRPTGFFSDMESYLRMAERGRCWLVGDGRARINPISGADLAVVCADAIADGDRAVDVGGPETFTHRQVAELACDVAGSRRRVRGTPVGAVGSPLAGWPG